MKQYFFTAILALSCASIISMDGEKEKTSLTVPFNGYRIQSVGPQELAAIESNFNAELGHNVERPEQNEEKLEQDNEELLSSYARSANTIWAEMYAIRGYCPQGPAK